MNPIREIAEHAAKRFTGRSAPVVTSRDRGQGNAVPPPATVTPLNDPATGNAWFVLGVDSFDDTTKYF